MKFLHIVWVTIKNIGRCLWARCRLFLYFFFLICLLGNFGTIFSCGQWFFEKEHVTGLQVLRNFGTYTIAIAVTSFADVLLRKTEDNNRTWLLILFVSMAFAVAAGGIVLWVDSRQSLQNAAITSAALAAYLWFAAHWRDPHLIDSYAALGEENPV